MVAPTQTPVYPSYPPGYTPPQPPRRRLWPAFVGVGVGSAAVAALVTALITSGSNSAEPITSRAATATTTVTVAPSSPPAPAALPTAQADRQTCQAWLTAGALINSSANARSVLPSGMTVSDPAVRANPDWSSAVQRSAGLYRQAAEVLRSRVAPGSTEILAASAQAEAATLQALSISVGGYDAANGNNYEAAKQGGNAMDVLCQRLAP